MKLTNTKTNKSIHVTQATLSILNYLAAKSLVSRSEENKEGYFYCSGIEIAEYICRTPATVAYHMKKLRTLKIVDIRLTGPNKSIYKVNEFKVTEI